MTPHQTQPRLDIDIESDIDISPTWGVSPREDARPGGSDVRVKIDIDGDADRETLEKVVADAIKWSPVVNTYTRPANLTHEVV